MKSTHKSDYGEFKWTAGKFYGDAEKDKGVYERERDRERERERERERQRERDRERGRAGFTSPQESKPARMQSSMLAVPLSSLSPTRVRPWSFSSLSNTNRRLTVGVAT